MGKSYFAFFGAAILCLLTSAAVRAQCSTGPPAVEHYYPPPAQHYHPPAQHYHPPAQHYYPPAQAPPPTIIYQQPIVFPQNGCQSGGAYAPTIEHTSTVEYVPHETPSSTLAPTQPDPEEVTGVLSAEPTEKEPAPAQPWNQWADMPPLKGDFQAMIQQVTGDIDWMLTAQGEKFSPNVKSILLEAKTNLETSCRVCDEDPDLFAGVQPGGESVRNVGQQLESFRQLISESLQQPSMQTLMATVAPARNDKSKVGSVMGALDGGTKQKLFGMFALETLEKRGDELIAHAKAVENGTFRPVGVDSLQQDLKTGDLAPNFSIQTADGSTVSLEDYRGKRVVLVFNRGHF